MSSKKISLKYAILFILTWLIVGGGLLFIFFLVNKKKIHTSLSMGINNIAIHSQSDSEFITKISKLFTELPNLFVILTVNENNKLIGSIYESNRISVEKYNNILSRFKDDNNTWAPVSAKSALHNEFYVMIYHTTDSKKVYLVYSQLQNDIYYFVKQHITSILIYCLLGIVLLFSYTNRSTNLETVTSLDLKNIEPAPFIKKEIIKDFKEQELSQPAKETERTTESSFLISDSSSSYINQTLIFDDQVKSLVNDLYYQFHCKSICFYIIANNEWRPFIYKVGKLLIKDSLANNTIPRGIEMIDMNAPEMMVDPDNLEMVIPAQTKQEIIGAFHIVFNTYSSFTEEVQLEIQHAIEIMSKNLVLQYSFEKSIIDDETQFYTYPYLCTLLNEKIRNQSQMDSVAIEIKNFKELSLQSLYLWTRTIDKVVQDFIVRTFRLVDSKNHYLIARRAQDQFIILLETPKRLSIEQFKALLEILQEQSLQCSSSKIEVNCAIINPAKVDSIEAYIRYIHHSLRQSMSHS